VRSGRTPPALLRADHPSEQSEEDLAETRPPEAGFIVRLALTERTGDACFDGVAV
jgi:hypothetical protein